MTFIARWAMKVMHWSEMKKMYRRSLEKSAEDLFAKPNLEKSGKSLAPGRAAGGKFELNGYTISPNNSPVVG